ncbi:hypothetical protein BDQ17DRAFT_1328962 [Cyathus striatus]|nr:hypothetical protein BDQ17DRAFT_1328962 [Cyathus striatus]
MSALPSLFNVLGADQKSMQELVRWSTLTGRMVVMDYPTENGESHIVPTDNGNVYAHCYEGPSKCGYSDTSTVDISNAYKNATLESEYRNLVIESHGHLDMAGVISSFFLQPEAIHIKIRTIKCLSGYCGEHKSQFMDLQESSEYTLAEQPLS